MDDPVSARGAAPPSPPKLPPAHILLVEDDALLRETLARVLQIAGYRVTRAGDGTAGMAAFEAVRPDLVLTDIIMPGRDGIELIMLMRRAAPEVPIVAISGDSRLGGDSVLRIAERLGARRLLQKPFERSDLLAVLEACLSGAG